MAKFKFRLTTLLRLREATRDERHSDLAQAHQADDILAEQEQSLDRELADNKQKCCLAAGPGQLDVDQLLEVRRFDMILRSNRQQLAQQRQAVQTEIERRRNALTEANREVRVLEKLRERQLDRHRDEESKKQTKELDEMAQRCVGQEGDR